MKSTHSQRNTEAEVTKLHMAIHLTLMDNVIPKKISQPHSSLSRGQNPTGGEKDKLSAVTQELLGIFNSFYAGW